MSTTTAPTEPTLGNPPAVQENVSATLTIAAPATWVFAVLTGQDKGDGHLEFGGWIWRHDLTPLGPSETEVTLSYDWSAVPQYIRERGIQFPPFGSEHLPNSLHHLAELAAPTTGN